MTRGPLVFRQTDLARAIKAAIQAGVQVGRIEITKDGSIVIHAGKPEEEDSGNPWDKVLGHEDQDR